MRIRVSRGVLVLAGGVAVMGLVGVGRSGGGLATLWERVWPWLVVAMAAALHELGHVIAAWGAGVGIHGLKLDLFGARMELRGLLSYGQEFWVAAGGPLVNLLSAALIWPLWLSRGGGTDGGLFLFLAASMILGGVNLLPVGTLDGGRMLRSLVSWLCGDRAAEATLRVMTVLLLGGLWMLAIYALLRAGQMLSVFVFALCLLFRAVGGHNEGV